MEDDKDSEFISCVLCCEETECFSIGVCDHPICVKCSARMRILSNQKYCPSCRADLEQVVFCSGVKKYKEFALDKMLANRRHGIRFENGSLRKMLDSLLNYSCSICDHEPFNSMKDLKSHIRKDHEKQFCLICIQNLSSFPFELKLYSRKEMVRHRKEGDSDEKSHRGHPECRFCDERFFDNDALLLHLRKSHFWCHFCEHDGKQDYYDAYDNLRRHFASEHFLCDEGPCENEKFTSVFRDKIDFQAHKLACHRKRLNKSQTKEARKVEIDFSFGTRSSNNKNKESSITGSDYEDIRTQPDSRSNGNNNNSNDNQRSNRYHRENNGTLNFYDYEDVEKDRKKFLGKPRRHEAEEVDNTKMKTNRRMAATRSLSQSEPDISSKYVDIYSLDDDVIGFSERLGDEAPKPSKPVQSKKEEKITTKEIDTKKKAEPEIKVVQPEPVVGEKMEDFPSLPGTKSFKLPTGNTKRTEDFPALPNAPAAKPRVKPAPGLGGKDAATVFGGMVIKSAKTKKKGKVKGAQNRAEDFPTLSSKPPPSKFNKFNDVQQNPPSHSQQKVKQPQSPSPPKKVAAQQNPPRPQQKAKQPQSPSPPKKVAAQQNPPTRPPSRPEVVKENRPPPGFSKGSNSSSSQTNASLAERNMSLMAMLMKFLDEQNMNSFKNLSGKFRRGEIDVDSYYIGISGLLRANLKFVFSELVSLLPDEEKQAELLRVHNDAKVKKKQKVENATVATADYSKPQVWGAKNGETIKRVETAPVESLCEKCGVMVANDRIQEHLVTHGELFPALPVSTKKKKNYSFSPAAQRYYSKQTPAKSAWGK